MELCLKWMSFGVSLLCIGIAYAMIELSFGSHALRLGCYTVLGLMQIGFQLLFFTPSFDRDRPKWSHILTLFMIIVVVLVIGGSLWIMNELHYMMHS